MDFYKNGFVRKLLIALKNSTVHERWVLQRRTINGQMKKKKKQQINCYNIWPVMAGGL